MPLDSALDQTSSPDQESITGDRFSSLRGVRWRIYLGILPQLPASIDDLRRVAADSRRRYANLRRRLIVDPHLSKDDSRSPDLVMDNPLSQSPDSIWTRYFQNAELERMLDQDLSRLYPAEGSYFQTSTCQTLLRRILLLWCLIHPECGYRQGMHELLAPLLYVLYVDLAYLSHVRGQYEDHFNDEFQGVSLPETDLSSTYRFEKITNRNTETERNNSSHGRNAKVRSLNELDPETRDIFLMSDAYGVEGELGIVVSEKFMEHDAYCMFDNLMNDVQGVVVMAEFFSPSPTIGSNTGLPPIIEASSAIYQLLAIVDSSLHSHLVELEVEPQYFLLRWLRVLFGREFSLEDLLVIWDEIFSFPNQFYYPDKANEADFRCRILCSPRGAYILAMAVSMLLHLRSSLLATDYATACLQRLLNFPEDVNAQKLIVQAKSLQTLALDLIFSSSSQGGNPRNSPSGKRGHGLSYGSSPSSPIQLSDSYWEEKWRLLHAAEELKKVNNGNAILSEKGKEPVLEREPLTESFSLYRTQSYPYPMEIQSEKDNVDDASRWPIHDTDADKDQENYRCDGFPSILAAEDSPCLKVKGEVYFSEQTGQNITRRQSDIAGEACNADNFSTATSPHRVINDHEYDSEESSITSSSLMINTYDEINHVDKLCNSSIAKEEITKCESEIEHESYREAKKAAASKQWRSLAGRFQWLRKLNRGSDEGIPEKSTVEQKKFNPSNNITIVSASEPCCSYCRVHRKIENEEKNVTEALRRISKSMLDNIEVIESILKQNQVVDGADGSGSNTNNGGKGQVVAFAALEELRKISNFLSDM